MARYRKRTPDHLATRAPGSRPLVRVLRCDALDEPSSRHSLAGLTSIELGRTDKRTVRRDQRTLTLGLCDARASTRHARLSRVLDEWVLEDLGSRNGVTVNGERQTRKALADRDLIEIGRTFFVFRAALAVDDSTPDAEAPEAAAGAPGLTTWLPSLASAFAQLGEVVRAQLPVLVEGESGTGKELVARAAHALARRRGQLVAVNCGALAPNLVESELFGACKGAFSGADRDRLGLVRSADGGTLFLDEIGELPATAQVALLRVLQEREVTPVGGTRPVRVELNLVAATHRDLPAQIAAGRFRADLYARLAGHRLVLPPLRERFEDLGIILSSLLRRAGRTSTTLSVEAARALFAHRWPLNVRELEHCLLGAAATAKAGKIALEDLRFAPLASSAPPAVAPVLDSEDAALRERLVALLAQHRGNVTRVAEALGKERMQIHRWLKRFAIALADYRR